MSQAWGLLLFLDMGQSRKRRNFPRNLSILFFSFSLFLIFDNAHSAPPSPRGVDLVIDRDQALQSYDVVQWYFPLNACEVVERCVRGPGWRTLLRVNGAVVNQGTQDLFLGNPRESPYFQYDACRNLYELDDYMSLQLLDHVTLKPVLVEGVAATGTKKAFCIVDHSRMTGDAPSSGYDCRNQGLTVGWEDVYSKTSSCQWVDVTDVPSGDYVLRLTVNPKRVIPEAHYDNDSTDIPVWIP